MTHVKPIPLPFSVIATTES